MSTELFVSGAMTAGYCVATLFFLRFRRESRDRLFLAFAVAFGLLAIQRMGLSLYLVRAVGDDTWLYVVRLAAFLIILGAILDKNRASRPRGP